MTYVTNTATGMKYPFVQGSAEEAGLFRVTPVEPSASKMYFDSKEQYVAWRTALLGKNVTLRKMGVACIPGRAYTPQDAIVISE
jgi:hypothetical protein